MSKIDKITIAVGDINSMKNFYGQVLGVAFQPVEMFGSALYVGKSGSIEWMLCPKEIAQVDAKVNTVQLRFIVEDVEKAYQAGLAAGGKDLNAPAIIEGRKHAALRDPDNNSLELVE